MNESELEAMMRVDDRHWWYRGRRRIVRTVIDVLPLPPPRTASILDAGCGSGRMLDDLSAFGVATGIDSAAACVEATRSRGHEVVEGRVESLPFDEATFDLVTCLDVLEHLADDVGGLRELGRVARPGGYLVVTVPAYPSLWSCHDVLNNHYRRYRRRGLRDAARAAGLRVVRETSFNTVALLPAAVVRWGRRFRASNRTASSDLDLTPRSLDRLLELPLAMESKIIGRGLALPVGLSHLVVLQRPTRTRFDAGEAGRAR